MIAAENWCVKVDDKVYGPYSTQQMRKFAHEGRLASWSLISPAGARSWREARDELAFSTFFGFEPAHANKQLGKVFGKRDENPINQHSIEENKSKIVVKEKPNQFATDPKTNIANFVIVFDVVSAAASRVEAAITSLGVAFRIADNVWSLSCELTVIGVRNAIAPYLQPSESIFVVDTTRGRTSWQNYTPEAHAKISAAYLATKCQ